MVQPVPWPISAHKAADEFDAKKHNRVGVWVLMDDGGVYVYGRNANGDTIAAAELHKHSGVTDWEFIDTAVGDDGIGVERLAVAQAALTDDDYGWYAWIHPDIAVSFVSGALTVGAPWGLSATATQGRAAVLGTDVWYGTVNTAKATAAGNTQVTLRT